MPVDENPSEEDIKRFSEDETGYCPSCGKKIWDDSNQCNSCGEWVSGDTLHQDPITRGLNKKIILIITAFILITFFWGLTRYF